MDLTSADFPVHWPVQTRWPDNDMFGHLNNAVYYELFDTAINAWIGAGSGTDAMSAPWLGVVAESGCRYFAELKFPADLVVGLAVTRLGTSSVTYRTALFEAGGRPSPRCRLGRALPPPRRTDSDELGGAGGPQQEECGCQHDQHDAQGEHDQGAAAPAPVGVPHPGP